MDKRYIVNYEQAILLSKLDPTALLPFDYVCDILSKEFFKTNSTGYVTQIPAPYVLDVVGWLLENHDIVFYVDSYLNEDDSIEYMYVIEASYYSEEKDTAAVVEDGNPPATNHFDAYCAGLTTVLTELLERKQNKNSNTLNN